MEKEQNSPGRPTIVFLHDSLGSVKLWRDFPKKLSDNTRCNYLVYDRIGYGKSDAMTTHERPINYMELEADTLNSLLSELQIKNSILFGHSDGGTIGLVAASKYPEMVKAVVCEAGHIFVEDVTLNGILQAKQAYQTTNLAERLKKYHGDKVETMFKVWTETWTRQDFRDWNIEEFLPNITTPLLFIQGKNDEYGTLRQVDQTISNVRGPAKKHIIPGVGHTPHKEVPEITLEAAKDFILSL